MTDTPELPPLPEPTPLGTHYPEGFPAPLLAYTSSQVQDYARAYAAEAVRVALSNVVPAESVACWRTNYGLDKRTPGDASRWWSDAHNGMAPAGAVAALGTVLDALEQKDHT